MWNNYLYDKGLVPVKEPFQKLVHQGMILGSNGIKMGKRYPEYSSVTVIPLRTLPKKQNPGQRPGQIDGDPYESRTRHSAVKGRRLNRLTNGPSLVAAAGFEPATCRV